MSSPEKKGPTRKDIEYLHDVITSKQKEIAQLKAKVKADTNCKKIMSLEIEIKEKEILINEMKDRR